MKNEDQIMELNLEDDTEVFSLDENEKKESLNNTSVFTPVDNSSFVTYDEKAESNNLEEPIVGTAIFQTNDAVEPSITNEIEEAEENPVEEASTVSPVTDTNGAVNEEKPSVVNQSKNDENNDAKSNLIFILIFGIILFVITFLLPYISGYK